MFKELSAKYYQNNKERLQRKVLSMRKKKKSDNMGVNNIKISLKMKDKGQLGIEKKYHKIWKNKDGSSIKTA